MFSRWRKKSHLPEKPFAPSVFLNGELCQVKLGLLPGAQGTQRLPRVAPLPTVGVPKICWKKSLIRKGQHKLRKKNVKKKTISNKNKADMYDIWHEDCEVKNSRWYNTCLLYLSGKNKTFAFQTVKVWDDIREWLVIIWGKIYVPGSKLPLFPYNRGWSSTQ